MVLSWTQPRQIILDLRVPTTKYFGPTRNPREKFEIHKSTMARLHEIHEAHNGMKSMELSTLTSFPYVIEKLECCCLFQYTVGLECLSFLRANRYSCLHLFHKPSLHRLIYLCRFFIVSLSFSWGAAKNVLHVHGSNYLEPKLDSQFLLPYRLLTCYFNV